MNLVKVQNKYCPLGIKRQSVVLGSSGKHPTLYCFNLVGLSVGAMHVAISVWVSASVVANILFFFFFFFCG